MAYSIALLSISASPFRRKPVLRGALTQQVDLGAQFSSGTPHSLVAEPHFPVTAC
jgi:hypothetical protein